VWGGVGYIVERKNIFFFHYFSDEKGAIIGDDRGRITNGNVMHTVHEKTVTVINIQAQVTSIINTQKNEEQKHFGDEAIRN
jgi:hypothetical protein